MSWSNAFRYLRIINLCRGQRSLIVAISNLRVDGTWKKRLCCPVSESLCLVTGGEKITRTNPLTQQTHPGHP